MSSRPRVGLIGGTFDPIHLGHLAAARAAGRELDLDLVRFLPSARPPHRPDSPQASEYHRLEMTRLAVGDADASSSARWEVSDLELRRNGPSFTFDTLAALLQEGLTPLQIFFIIGADAFAEIATWHRYPDVLDAAHFAVISRPGTTLEHLRARLPSLAARIAAPLTAVTAETTRIILIEAATPNVSSTEVRRRAARGESLEGLVTPAVAAYIAQHSLYRH
jgi:nicotinate-nucleotide adenylyltransferase